MLMSICHLHLASLMSNRPSLEMIEEGLHLAFQELDLIDDRGEEPGMSMNKAMDIISQKTPLSEANLKSPQLLAGDCQAPCLDLRTTPPSSRNYV